MSAAARAERPAAARTCRRSSQGLGDPAARFPNAPAALRPRGRSELTRTFGGGALSVSKWAENLLGENTSSPAFRDAWQPRPAPTSPEKTDFPGGAALWACRPRVEEDLARVPPNEDTSGGVFGC